MSDTWGSLGYHVKPDECRNRKKSASKGITATEEWGKTRRPLMTVHNRVWEAWRELEQRVDEPAIVLLFSSDQALPAVRQAASEAVRELQYASAAS